MICSPLRRPTLRSLLIAGLAAALAACTTPQPEPEASEEAANAGPATTVEEPDREFKLPLPAGWGSESFAFPLSFAPDLPYRGVEEIRFAPGWSDPQAEDFWSYVFVWWIEPAGAVDAATLEGQLESYFRGLAAGGQVDDTVIQEEVDARLEETGDGYRGTVRIVDTFATQAPLDLFLEATRSPCADAGRELWVFSWSPQERSHPVWQELKDIHDGAGCA